LILIEAHPIQINNDRLNTEYLVLKNTGLEEINLKEFTLSDAQNHEYTFPSITMQSGAILTIYTGEGVTSNTEYYLGLDKPIWNNSGDTLTIENNKGEVVLQKAFRGNEEF